MRRVVMIAWALGASAALAACGARSDAGSQGSGEAAPAQPPAPAICPAGNAVERGACVVVVTPETVAAVDQQETRLDELARLLDQVDLVGAPIERFDAIRRTGPWQALAARSEKLAAAGTAAGGLRRSVEALRAFQRSLGEASARFGNLRGELERIRDEAGAAPRIEEVRAQVQAQLRAAVEPLAAQLEDAIQNAIAPLTAQLPGVSGAVTTACTAARPSGGKLQELCAQATGSFPRAVAYVDEIKARSTRLYGEISAQLEAALAPLLEAETNKLLDAARRRVDAARSAAPAAAPGAAGAPGPGSGAGR